MSQLSLLLVRHGECLSNYENIFIGRTQDPALTRNGIRQARSLAQYLKPIKISAIFSSTLLRASQTARIIAEEKQLPITYSESLIEVGLGVLDGLDIGNPGFLSVYENMVANWERGCSQVCVPHGEALLDVKERINNFFQTRILIKEWDGPILIVGHAILWMAFIWVFCKNHSSRINDGFLEEAHYSIITKNESGFLLNNNIESIEEKNY